MYIQALSKTFENVVCGIDDSYQTNDRVPVPLCFSPPTIGYDPRGQKMFTCTRTLRSGRVVSSSLSSRSNSRSTKTGGCKERDSSKIKIPQSNDNSNLNNAHLSDAHGTVKLSPSSKLAAKVNDIEDLVGGQRGTWGHDTGSLGLRHDLGIGGVKIKQEPGIYHVYYCV